jgi:aldehyde dehydrogenase (NAD+)
MRNARRRDAGRTDCERSRVQEGPQLHRGWQGLSAKLVAGGGTKKINGKGLFIEPTVFANATNDLKISREEIFGPVVPVIPFESEEEAVRLANDTAYGLASGIQTGDLRRALRLADRIKAGTVWLNTWHKYHPSTAPRRSRATPNTRPSGQTWDSESCVLKSSGRE